MTALLDVQHLTVTFGANDAPPVVNDVSFSIAPGETLGLVGESGLRPVRAETGTRPLRRRGPRAFPAPSRIRRRRRCAHEPHRRGDKDGHQREKQLVSHGAIEAQGSDNFVELPFDLVKQKVSMLTLGGTIAMTPSTGSGAVVPRLDSADLLRARGCDVHTVAIDEFEKAEAGMTCLSLLLDRSTGARP